MRGPALSLAGVLAAALAPLAVAQEPASTPAEPLPLFGRPFPDADFETLSIFRLGNAVFRTEWAVAGEGPRHFDGLGPLYNARSCEGCHIKDGRGAPIAPGGGDYAAASMLVKLARPGGGPDPVYGRQIQDFAVAGQRAEGRVRVDYRTIVFAFRDGEIARLRAPRYSIEALGYGALAPGTALSARIAPPMIGLGLIARIPDEEITSFADAHDRDGDGISGRVNRVASPALGRRSLGRFGWKAGRATLADQIALAFSRDMGIATPLHPPAFGDCTSAETACRQAPDGRSPEFENLEAHSVILEWLVRYAENLAVPEPRGAGEAVVEDGRALFAAIGCAACHRPTFTTGPDPDQRHLGGREIHPYTDLLVHDMGPGLADGVGEGEADGAEWRTAPLWGVGLAGVSNGNNVFLHDGRARTITEAILWHGGEARAARDGFATLGREDRAKLVGFVASL